MFDVLVEEDEKNRLKQQSRTENAMKHVGLLALSVRAAS